MTQFNTSLLDSTGSSGVIGLDSLQSKLLYSRSEAALLLNMSLRTIDRLAAAKELPVRRNGRRVSVTRDALLQFIRRDHATQHNRRKEGAR